jgi:hypothetical protein
VLLTTDLVRSILPKSCHNVNQNMLASLVPENLD